MNHLRRALLTFATAMIVLLGSPGLARAGVPVDRTHTDAVSASSAIVEARLAAVSKNKGNAGKALDSLGKAVVKLRAEVTKLAASLDAGKGNAATSKAVEALDTKVMEMGQAVAAVPRDAPLSAKAFDAIGARHGAVLDRLDALMGLLEPVIFR